MNREIILSDHGKMRVRKRLHWSARAAQRMLPRILSSGITEQTNPQLFRTLQITGSADQGLAVRVFSGAVFVFVKTKAGEAITLLTSYPLRGKIRKLL